MGEYFQNGPYLHASNVLVESSLNNKPSCSITTNNSYDIYVSYPLNPPYGVSPTVSRASINENTNVNAQTVTSYPSLIDSSKLDESKYPGYYGCKEDTQLASQDRFYQINSQHGSNDQSQAYCSLIAMNHMTSQVSSKSLGNDQSGNNSSEQNSENEDEEQNSDRIFPWMKRVHGWLNL
jgi:hypothetical protein